MKTKDQQIANLILSLRRLKGVGNKAVQKFIQNSYEEIEETDNYSEVWLRSIATKVILKGLDNGSVSWLTIQAESETIIQKALQQKIRFVHPFMNNYPKRMLVLNNYPLLLFYIGNEKLLNAKKSVAIIGTREPTKMGIKIARRLSEKLARDGYTIVSGLAIGSDTVGHIGALNVGGGTIAVIPTPIDAPIYPKENQSLADRIVDNDGLIISEYAPGKKLRGRELINNLVARDEWQPALSDGLIATETSVTGGSNHAIGYAIKTETPLGVFDYSQQLGDEFYHDARFSGNIKYLKNSEAIPIFTERSVLQFENLMNNYNEKVEKEYAGLSYAKGLDNNNTSYKQTDFEL